MKTYYKTDKLYDWMVTSDLYNNFDDEIVIPDRYVLSDDLNNLKITNDADFYKLLDTLRYWMINIIPYEIYDYVIKSKEKGNLDLHQFENFTLFNSVILFNRRGFNELLNLDLIINKQQLRQEYFRLIALTVSNNHFDLLRYLQEHITNKNQFFLHSEKIKKLRNEKSSIICGYAIANDNLDILKYLHENGYNWDSVNVASVVGRCNLQMLKYMYKYSDVRNMLSLEIAIKKYDLDIIKFLLESKSPVYMRDVDTAIKLDHFDVLKMLEDIQGVLWNLNNLLSTVTFDKKHILEYFLNRMKEELQSKDQLYQVHKKDFDKLYTKIINDNSLEYFKFLHDYGIPLPNNVLNIYFGFHPNYSYRGRINDDDTIFLEYIISTSCELNRKYIMFCASRGLINHLKILHLAQCPWDERAVNGAISNDNLNCLKYLHENGCPNSVDEHFYLHSRKETECCKYYISHMKKESTYAKMKRKFFDMIGWN